MHRFIFHNEDIREASDKVLSPGQVGLLSGWGVFSTIKVCDGVLFAWERHWARMKRDAALLHVPLPEDSERVRLQLLKLLDANHATDATLRVVVVRNNGGMWQGPSTGRASDLIALSADLKDWGSGVKLTYAPQARHSQCAFAGTKVLAWSFNLTWLEDAQAQGFDEVILLNERREVSECTSANVFIAKGREVFTPPLSSGCLPGVTRDLLLSDVRLAEYPVTERVMKPGDLENADEVFITSTTRDLLPVVEIDGKKIRNAGNACASLKQAFGDYVSRYVADHRAVSVR